jgi:hypothetical protein
MIRTGGMSLNSFGMKALAKMQKHDFPLVVLVVAMVMPMAAVHAQNTPSGKTLAATLEVYAFPQKGQTPEQQSKDEAACYDWASAQTGSDPFKLKKQQIAQTEAGEAALSDATRSGGGAGVKGAVRGAAAGAIIGEIVDDDAGKGAAIGTAAGVVGGRRKARRAQRQKKSDAAQEAQTQLKATEAELQKFKQAFGVCLEAKEYEVTF